MDGLENKMITYLPSKILAKLKTKKLAENLVNDNLTLNKAAVKTLTNTDLLSKDKITEIAIRVINGYKKKYSDLKDDGESKSDAINLAMNDKANMVREIEQASLYNISQQIKVSYHRQKYVWLPSGAETPDPLHQLKYGEVFRIGVGEMPGDRYGCQCGMQILVDETKLNLE